jgi:hypothetical protein
MLYTVELVCRVLSFVHSSLHSLCADVDRNMTLDFFFIACCEHSLGRSISVFNVSVSNLRSLDLILFLKSLFRLQMA